MAPTIITFFHTHARQCISDACANFKRLCPLPTGPTSKKHNLSNSLTMLCCSPRDVTRLSKVVAKLQYIASQTFILQSRAHNKRLRNPTRGAACRQLQPTVCYGPVISTHACYHAERRYLPYRNAKSFFNFMAIVPINFNQYARSFAHSFLSARTCSNQSRTPSAFAADLTFL